MTNADAVLIWSPNSLQPCKNRDEERATGCVFTLSDSLTSHSLALDWYTRLCNGILTVWWWVVSSMLSMILQLSVITERLYHI